MSLSFSSHDWAKLPETPALPAHLQACKRLWENKETEKSERRARERERERERERDREREREWVRER